MKVEMIKNVSIIIKLANFLVLRNFKGREKAKAKHP